MWFSYCNTLCKINIKKIESQTHAYMLLEHQFGYRVVYHL